MLPFKDSSHARPFVKWAGGKTSLLPQIMEHVPETIRNYYEPFVGGGAVFFELARGARIMERSYLNDTNDRLMGVYRALRKNRRDLIRILSRMSGPKWNTQEAFERVRERLNRGGYGQAADAAHFLYLNKTCFNGLYRENAKGEFNVPFGRYKNPKICDAENLEACARALQSATLTSQGFGEVLGGAKRGDLVFCDPPYMQRTGAEFVGYQAGGFTALDHAHLRDIARDLKKKGVSVLLCNADTEEVRELYAGFSFHMVSGRRSIGANRFRRGHVPDLLIW